MGVGTTLTAPEKQPTLVAGVKHQGKHMVGGSGGMTLSWAGSTNLQSETLGAELCRVGGWQNSKVGLP